MVRQLRAATLAVLASLLVVILAAVGASPVGAVPATGGWPPLRSGEHYGIDISSYQGQPAWSEVAQAGIAFAYVKATEGTTYVNPEFASDWAGAKAAGLAYGAYQFYSLCSPGLAQAQAFLAVVPPDRGALPPAVDLELSPDCAARPSVSVVAAQVGAFVRAVQKARGRSMVFYVGWSFGARYKLALFRTHRLWLRRDQRPAAGTALIWQWTQSVTVPGIVDAVDLDLARPAKLR